MINLNYNNDRCRIDDELFNLAEENTLFSLRNGGGKSVLVQMLMAPFVGKRHRDMPDRPFASYFSTHHPTFILVEWCLDNDAGYVMTGMMVRQAQSVKDDENPRELDLVNFIYEYTEENDMDIKHFPVISRQGAEKSLKNFRTCRKLFDGWKQDMKLKFDFYDLNNPPRRRAYFGRLEQYQIYTKEWESIIKKVNLKESGLSDLFKEAKDEKGLVEKWLIPTVADKLNKEKDRIAEFQSLMSKYIYGYKEQKSKYERKDRILKFESETKPWLVLEEQLQENETLSESFRLDLAMLFNALGLLMEETRSHQENLNHQITKFEAEITNINYEEKSLEIYELQDEIEQVENRLEWEEEELANVNSELEQAKRDSHCLEAKRIDEKVEAHSQDVQEYENRIANAKKKGDELIPHKNNLGFTIRHRLENQQISLAEEISELAQQIQKNKTRNNEEKIAEDLLASKLIELNREESSLKMKLTAFEEAEKQMNDQFQTNYYRNLEGEYEPKFLDFEHQTLEDKKQSIIKEKKQLAGSIQNMEEENHKLGRDLQDLHQLDGRLQVEQDTVKKHLEDLDTQMSQRREILPYIDFYEADLLNQEKILAAFQDLIAKENDSFNKQRRCVDALNLEYNKIKSGRMSEFSKGFLEKLEKLGIHYLEGMQWLKRNKKTEKQNQTLVAANPLIPYSLIISKQDFIRLQNSVIDVFTNSPVPIIIRENLETPLAESVLIRADHAYFYVLYDGRLLNSKHLAEILATKEKTLQEESENLTEKAAEIEFLRSKESLVRHQTLTETKYKATSKKRGDIEKEIQENGQNLTSLHSKQEEIRINIEKANRKVSGLESKSLHIANQLVALKDLASKYETFLNSKQELLQTVGLIKETEVAIKAVKKNISQTLSQIDQQRGLEYELRSKAERLKDELMEFLIYKNGEIIEKDLDDLKAEYRAILSKISGDLLHLETELQKANKHYEDESDHLISHLKNYNLVDSDYKELIYADYKRENSLERIRSFEAESVRIQKIVRETDREKVALSEKLKLKLEYLFEHFKTEEIMPKLKIVKRAYKEEIAEINRNIKLAQQEEKRLSQHFNLLLENKGQLSAFENPKVDVSLEMIEELKVLDKEGWRHKRGNLVRDFHELERTAGSLRREISNLSARILRLDEFEEDFFKLPLTTLYDLQVKPHGFLEQYQIIIASFKNMLEKLEIDISINEKEKSSLLNLFLDYLAEVHNNLGQIDKNSRITIRERNLQMLKVKLPDWENQEEVYFIRLEEFIMNLANRCLELIEANENIENEISRQIKTIQLYDAVVGTSTVEIKLYKIEADREFQINWDSVAKNSGGEGFLSAFVILSSLLSYMRRDDSDLFATGEEGKVLLMDNPFAQTNAAHLLKPLIELAKKNNTQLICLSGLGGDSIYSRFENIYSLSLKPSSLHKGNELLKSEHIKGDFEIITPARIHVQEEQISLF